MNSQSGAFPAARRLARIAFVAVAAKYRLDSGRGLLSFLVAVFDPYLYALTVYFVLVSVFKLEGIERLHVLLIGFMAFRWGISSLLAAANLTGIMRRMAEHSRLPLCSAVVAVTAPPAFVFLVSLASAFVFLLVVDSPEQSFATVGWLSFVIAIQAVWIVALILLLAFLQKRRLLHSDVPVVVVASLFWILSPVMYMFRDIPAGASKFLTSYNPVSHLLAAYHNAYWYGQDVSLEVLPVVTAFGIGLIWILGRFAFRMGRNVFPGTPVLPGQGGLKLVYDPVQDSGLPREIERDHGPTCFVPWRARFKDLRGRDLARLLIANWHDLSAERDAALEQIVRTSNAGRLFDDFLAIYPDQVLDQLAFAVAIHSPRAAITIDGMLDTASPATLAVAWQRVSDAVGKGRSVTIICHRPLLPPDGMHGAFEIWGRGEGRREGTLGPELAQVYAEIDRRESLEGRAGEGMVGESQPQLPLESRVLVSGGSSQIGQCIIRRLDAAGIAAFAIGRKQPAGVPADRFIEKDLAGSGLIVTAHPDAMVHIAALWLLPPHLEALYACGIRRLVCFSTTSIFIKHESSDAWERDLVARTVAAEEAVSARCAALGIACTILRPTLVYGLGVDRNISRAANFIRKFRCYPLAGGAMGLRQPVHADDLAAVALTALVSPIADGKRYDVGGGERLAYREMIGRIFDVLGMPRRFVPIPLLGLFAATAGFVLRRPELTGDMVARMRRDLICDNGPAMRDLGYAPRAFLSAGEKDIRPKPTSGIDTLEKA